MFRILLAVFLLCLLPAAHVSAGDVTFHVQLGGFVTANLGVEVSEVILCTYNVEGVAVSSFLDCDGTPVENGSGVRIWFEDEGLGTAPALAAAFFPGEVSSTANFPVADPASWYVLDDGVFRINAEALIQDSAPDCTTVSTGSMTTDDGTVAVRIVYDTATPTTQGSWSSVKAIYR